MDETILEPPPDRKMPERFAEIVENMSIGYLAIMLALAGFGSAWRDADRSWQPPESVSQWIQFAAGIVWATLVVIALLNGLPAAISSIRTPLFDRRKRHEMPVIWQIQPRKNK